MYGKCGTMTWSFWLALHKCPICLDSKGMPLLGHYFGMAVPRGTELSAVQPPPETV